MKILSRDFTRKEKILLLILAIILVGLIYYRVVYVYVEKGIVSARAEEKTLQTELATVDKQIAEMDKMQAEIDEYKASGDISRMGSYNNSRDEIAFLNDTLEDTLRYSITFTDVTRNGDQIRRNFTLQYQTENYDDAARIMRTLVTGQHRCQVGDIRCSVDQHGIVTINEVATFYETMVGGTPDSGLPADSAKTK